MPVELPPLKRRLTAVLLADVVGYSRLMSLDEDGTHGRIARYVKELIDPTVAEYGGRPVRSMGDGMLVEFGSALDAVRCGLDIQQRLAERQNDSQTGRIQLRIGINTGDVIADDRDIYGHSINITARLEGIAQPGSVYVSQSIYDQTRSQPGLRFIDKGLHRVKNIDYPIHVFEVGYGRASPIARRRLPRKYAGLAASAVVGLAVLGFFVAGDRGTVVQANSIIVLPFRNLSGNTEDDYFADAITDDLTTDLSRLPRAFVIASATALTYKGKAVDARQIGRECGVRFLLEGSVRRAGATVQVNAQLIDTETGAHVWADRFTHESNTLLDMQDAVTGRIGASLNVQMVKAEVRHDTGDLAANGNPLDERLRAMALMTGSPTPEKYLEARRHIEESLKKDPGSAESLAFLARLLISEYMNAWNNIGLKDVDRAEEAYQRALAIDPSVAVAHYAAGFVRRVRGDHDGALDEFEKAIKLNPNLAVAYAQKANELVFLGRGKEAVTTIRKALSLSPRDPSIGVFYWVIGRAYFTEGNYKDAATWLRKSVDERPNLWFNRAWLISAYSLTGRDKEARATLDDFKQAFPTYTLPRITEIYTKENQFDNDTIKAATEHLFAGLKKAGLQ
jgi:TolB-like protein/class 3 adenylate cyclase/Tfp pilus assembly protein PilF